MTLARDLSRTHHGWHIVAQGTPLGRIQSVATAVPDAPYVTVWTEDGKWNLPATAEVGIRP